MNKPFRLLMELKTPVTFRGWPVHLDGLLEYSLFCTDGNFPADSGKLDEFLQRDPDGHYCASAIAFGVTKDRTIASVSMNTVARLNEHELLTKFIAPNAGTVKSPKYAKLPPGGPQHISLEVYDGYFSPYVVFDGVGNGHKCAELLRMTIQGVGSQAARGFSGSIGEIYVNDLDRDLSVVDENEQLARVVSLETYQRIFPNAAFCHTRQGRTSPPYHNESNKKNVVLPELIRRVKV